MGNIELSIDTLIWDNWNVQHTARHNVLPEEVEGAATDTYAVFLQAKEGRIMMLGRVKERLLSVILAQQDDGGNYYVITARDMSKKERAFYRIQKEGQNDKE
jgi:uncharacterized DUF497 family protein